MIGFLPLAWPANGKTFRRGSDGQVEILTVLSPAILSRKNTHNKTNLKEKPD